MFGLMIWVLYLRVIVPILGVFYGTSLMADEVEDKTITYLFTRPIPRGAVLIGKYLAYLAVHGPDRAAVGDAGLLPGDAARRGGMRHCARLPGPAQGPRPAGLGPGRLRRACSRSSAPRSSGRCWSASSSSWAGRYFVLALPGYLKRFTRGLLPAGPGAARHAAGQRGLGAAVVLQGRRSPAWQPGGACGDTGHRSWRSRSALRQWRAVENTARSMTCSESRIGSWPKAELPEPGRPDGRSVYSREGRR